VNIYVQHSMVLLWRGFTFVLISTRLMGLPLAHHVRNSWNVSPQLSSLPQIYESVTETAPIHGI